MLKEFWQIVMIDWVDKCKLATVKSFNADILSISPSSLTLTKGWCLKRQLWNSVDKTKIILLYSPTDAAPQFLKHFAPFIKL